MNPQNLTQQSLISILVDDMSRRDLAKAMQKSIDRHNEFSLTAPKCEATVEDLRVVVAKIIEDGDDNCVFEDLVFHPNIPHDALFDLLERGMYITALAHRKGPKRLLEKLAEQHKYSEAITSLALYYYGKDDYSLTEFIEFIEKYQDDYMLKFNLLKNKSFSEEKTNWVQEKFGD